MRVDHSLAGGFALFALAVLPPLGPFLQSRLPYVVLLQYPLIIAGGILIGRHLAAKGAVAWTAAPALAAGVLALAFWLLPRWIDAALADPLTGLARALTLWLLAGVPLGWGWTMAGPVLRAWFLANVASMLIVMGWLQLVVPQRLCNAYLLSDQRTLGAGFLLLAAGMVLTVLLQAMAGPRLRNAEV